MPGTLTKVPRQFMGRGSDDVMAMPNLVDIQILSYERLLQRERLRDGEGPDRQGLEEVFRDTCFQRTRVLRVPNGDMAPGVRRLLARRGEGIKFSESVVQAPRG